MDGVALAIDKEKMDPRTAATYEEVVDSLGSNVTEAMLQDVLEEAAAEAIQANLDAMYEQRDGDLNAVVQQTLQE